MCEVRCRPRHSLRDTMVCPVTWQPSTPQHPMPTQSPRKVHFPARNSVLRDRILPPYYVPWVLRALALGVSPASGSGKRAPSAPAAR